MFDGFYKFKIISVYCERDLRTKYKIAGATIVLRALRRLGIRGGPTSGRVIGLRAMH